MKRNRMKQLHYQRRQRNQLGNAQKPQMPVAVAPPILWENDYYHYKAQLSSLAKKNEQIRYFMNQYQINPSVFNLQKLDNHIKNTCKKIDQIDHWLNSFPFTPNSYLQLQLQKNVVKHFRQQVFLQINKAFAYKQQISEISNVADQRDKSSFNAFNRSSNISYSQLNNSSGNERTQSMKEVTKRIQSLNQILRRMGDVVAFQGDIINRIDQNLTITHTYVRGGKDFLIKRVQRQQDQQETEQFSCQGKANKVITSLYLINIILIFILVLKNL